MVWEGCTGAISDFVTSSLAQPCAIVQLITIWPGRAPAGLTDWLSRLEGVDLPHKVLPDVSSFFPATVVRMYMY